MTISNDLQQKYAAAMAAVSGDDGISRLQRASLLSLVDKVPELHYQGAASLDMHLVHADLADVPVAAVEAADALNRLQRAIARLAKARRTRVIEVKRLARGDIDRARLNVLAAAPGSLTFQIQPQPAEDDENKLPSGGTTWTEIAMTDLLGALPETAEDSDVVDALGAGEPVLRRAVADLVQGSRSTNLHMDFNLHRPGRESLTSRLSAEQIWILRRTLNVPTEDRSTQRRKGRLDGVRTRRRIFYLELPSGGEIHGLIDEELLPEVRKRLENVIDVTLEVVTYRTRSGRAGQARYRLIGIDAEQPSLPNASS